MKVEPYISVGNFSFNQPREDVRQKINEPFDSGISNLGKFKLESFDYYPKSDYKLIYDDLERLQAVEFFNQNLSMDEFKFAEYTYDEIISHFRSLDENVSIDNNGFTSPKFGIGFEHLSSPNSTPKYAIVFRKGYYDRGRLPQSDVDSIVNHYLNLAKGIGD